MRNLKCTYVNPDGNVYSADIKTESAMCDLCGKPKFHICEPPTSGKSGLETCYVEIYANDKTVIRNCLNHCKEKLEIYRKHYGGEYKGGVQYTALIDEIDHCINLIST